MRGILSVLLLACTSLCALPAYSQADSSRSLRPRLPSQDAFDGFHSTFVKLTWEFPFFRGQPRLSTPMSIPTDDACTNNGRRFTVMISFEDSEGDVAGGQVRLLHRPSLYGASASLVDGTFAADTGPAGELSFDVCIDFDADTEVILEISVSDAGGNPSSFVSLPVANPVIGSSTIADYAQLEESLPVSKHDKPDGFASGESSAVPIAFVEFAADHSCGGAVQIWVGDPAAPQWETTVELSAEEEDVDSYDKPIICYAEADISNAAQFLPPSSNQPWFATASSGTLTAFSVTTEVGVTYYAADLPITLGPSEYAMLSGTIIQPTLLGYRILRGFSHNDAVILADSIPPYQTSYVDLQWEKDGLSSFTPEIYWIEALYGSFASVSAPAYTFYDVANETPLFNKADVLTEQEARGAIWGDFDNDDYPDLFVPRFAGPNKLFRFNPAQATFEEVSGWAGGNTANSTYGGTWGDYDNDGDLDLFVPNDGSANALYRNRLMEEGTPTFTAIDAGPLTSQIKLSRSAAWADYDYDGHLDLFVVNYAQPNILYHNEENGQFTEVTGPWSSKADQSMGGFWADYDNDGDQDIYVVNLIDAEPNLLYQNRLIESGEATFVSVLENIFGQDKGRSTSASWGDYDNDGDLDLFVANEYSPQNPSSLNWLYRNRLDAGQATFERIHATNPSFPIVSTPGKSNSSAWADFDSDGDLDLFSTTEAGPGEDQTIGGIRPLLYLNTTLPQEGGRALCRDGDTEGTFCRPTRGNATDYESGLRGLALADLNRDGLSDLFIADADRRPSLSLRNQFQEEQLPDEQRHWITLRLEGASGTNRSAIGARATLYTSAGGIIQQQMREVSALSGTGGQNSLALTFGLGRTTAVDSIVVRWPKYPSGEDTVLRNITSIDTLLVVQEPDVGTNHENHPDYDLPLEFTLRQNYPNPFNPVTTIPYDVPTEGRVTLTVMDLLGRWVLTLVDAWKPPGRHHALLDASDLPSGVYFYRMEAGSFSESKPLVVLK